MFVAAPADFKDVVLIDRKSKEFALRFVGWFFVKMQLLVYRVVNEAPGTRMRIYPIEKDCFCPGVPLCQKIRDIIEQAGGVCEAVGEGARPGIDFAVHL